jgi:hypothetical protein
VIRTSALGGAYLERYIFLDVSAAFGVRFDGRKCRALPDSKHVVNVDDR